VTRQDDVSEIALPREALDRASVTFALGVALREGRRAGRYEVADPDVFRTYEFASGGAESILTPLGELETYPVRQWRTESSRETTVWLAPALGFHAVRIEQRRPDRDPVAFALETFEWLLPDGSSEPVAPHRLPP
jgi:hypothetical protein